LKRLAEQQQIATQVYSSYAATPQMNLFGDLLSSWLPGYLVSERFQFSKIAAAIHFPDL